MNEHRNAEEEHPADREPAVPAGFELRYVPGEADDFIAQLWEQVPAAPDGPLIGTVHQIGDRGQIVLRLSCPTRQQVVLLPGQVLTAVDRADSRTWTVADGPPAYGWASRIGRSGSPA